MNSVVANWDHHLWNATCSAPQPAVSLRRDDVDVAQARLWVRRLKNGLSVEQPIAGDELRAIKRYLATRADNLPWLSISERGQPLTRQSVNYLVAGAAVRAGLPLVWPHMLRHSCGFYLAIGSVSSGALRERFSRYFNQAARFRRPVALQVAARGDTSPSIETGSSRIERYCLSSMA